MSAFRLAGGGAVDRARPLAFTFNGRALGGLAGDTLASALLANGVHLVGRSFKYHRPRGIFGAGFEDGNAVVQRVAADAPANELATRIELAHGLAVRSVNCWPSPRFDVGAVAQLGARLLGAGFYYKTFMWPDWHLFEPSIRKAAGLGTAPGEAVDDAAYETRFGHCDVLVVGAGAAGLIAARTAARSGARVMLVDDGFAPGGRLLADARQIDGAPAQAWIDETLGALRAGGARVVGDATVWGYLEHNMLAMVERRPGAGLRQRAWKIRAKQVVIATGAFERPIPFAGSDRPGVMLASAARTYVNRYAVKPGTTAVVFTNNDGAYDAAADLARAGIAVTVIDSRAEPPDGATARLSGLPVDVEAGAVVQEALGRGRVHTAVVADRGGAARLLSCDLVCVSGGWNPAFHLASQSREARAVWDDARATFVPQSASSRFHLAGAARGTFDLQGCLAEGARAGAAAARAAGFTVAEAAVPRTDGEAGASIEPLWFVPPPSRGKKVFVDLVNDVTVGDLALALREGYDHIEHVKRYTTAGMGIDQGKTVNVNVIGAVAAMRGLAPDAVGTTTFRQPYVPVEFGAIAGHRAGMRRTPVRRSPMFDAHVAAGAVMYEAGLRWQRPGFYPQAGEDMAAATAREARTVRTGVGAYDGSPLGKFLVKGPDAVRLLDLLYVNDFATLKPGHGRYGVMLWEDGLVMDDGVTFRLDEHSYLLHSSTGGADRVHGHIEELLQLHYPHWRVSVLPVTSQWANVTVCGPLTREVIRAAGTDIDLGRDAFPFMTLREGEVAGLPVRAARVSWTGELSIELNTPARHGLALWQTILAAGKTFGIAPVGSEANHVLRVEAGYISTGHETDGVVDVIDLGLGRMVSKTKADFIGKRAMAIGRAGNPVRRELVGYLPADPDRLVPEGAPVTPQGARTHSEGFVSACVRSVALGRTVALGLLNDGRARHGETVFAKLPDAVIPMTVVPPVFHDADRARVKG
ncbi:MAG: (2Fe-2S)-binding protein [Alphaproteobacteria bacterium]|nr:(2Fe-2S)-binding protein [Alphaproteobacteria bacterium]